MALWVCDECSTAYAPGAPACPHCGEAKHHEQGAEPDPAPAKKPAVKKAAAKPPGPDE